MSGMCKNILKSSYTNNAVRKQVKDMEGQFIADNKQVTGEPTNVIQLHWPLGNCDSNPEDRSLQV